MKKILAALTLSLFSAAAAAQAAPPKPEEEEESQVITRSGSQASSKGPAEYFTGDVRVQPLFAAEDAAAYGGAYVTFQPGARSAWHTHPAGQRLIVTEGVGRTQQWGGPVEESRAGDVLWCPPGVKHWHGAAPTSAMTHIALTGVRDVVELERGGTTERLPADPGGEYGLSADPDINDAYRIEFAAASRAIAAGAKPTFGRADAIDQAAAIEAVRRAAATGTRVNLPAPTGSAHAVTD